MKVFRLSKEAHSRDLSGKGAELSGGRWNSKGTALIYTSESRALCTAEVAVNLPLSVVPDDYQLVTFEIPDHSIVEFKQSDLPPDWRAFPHSHSTQVIGDQFVSEGKALVLKVPSAVVQGDFNYLINPRHVGITKVKVVTIVDYLFDTRLFER